MEQELLNTKRVYEQITVDTVAFEERVFRSLSSENPASKRFSQKKKVAAFVIPLIVLPLAGFTYVHYFMWGGAAFTPSKNMNGPTSFDANPWFVQQQLKQTGTKTFTLSQSIQKANFPIRQPEHIAGWKRVFSKGVQFPLYNYAVTSGHKQKLVSVTQTPFQYVDIYENSLGQRIAVTQQYNDGMSEAYKKSKGLSQWAGGVSWDFGKDNTKLQSFPGDMAWLVSGKWSQFSDQTIKKQPGGFENVIVLHPEKNNNVTEVVVDEYGNVSPSTMESFAHAYLEAPIK